MYFYATFSSSYQTWERILQQVNKLHFCPNKFYISLRITTTTSVVSQKLTFCYKTVFPSSLENQLSGKSNDTGTLVSVSYPQFDLIALTLQDTSHKPPENLFPSFYPSHLSVKVGWPSALLQPSFN